ncbi:hypothetical protein [Chryseobacterium luteum]|uniref:Uncharacterized protein n=1 Tax=Chryseobacterium luteum TaxID=421531 RepID=A0A085ZHE1_9FLAO|nr:hypothetical protein [Chryseobacterium luteum]KFF03855.1 hypothetical protein IX38_10630 [Chryseobacterium luteum]
MKKIKLYICGIILISLTDCTPSIKVPSKYGLGEHHLRYRLDLKKDNNYVFVYFPTLEKTTGKWSEKSDSLFLNSEYKSSLENEKDSVVYNERQIYIIKKDKLINPENKKFYLKRQK